MRAELCSRNDRLVRVLIFLAKIGRVMTSSLTVLRRCGAGVAKLESCSLNSTFCCVCSSEAIGKQGLRLTKALAPPLQVLTLLVWCQLSQLMGGRRGTPRRPTRARSTSALTGAH